MWWAIRKQIISSKGASPIVVVMFARTFRGSWLAWRSRLRIRNTVSRTPIRLKPRPDLAGLTVRANVIAIVVIAMARKCPVVKPLM